MSRSDDYSKVFSHDTENPSDVFVDIVPSIKWDPKHNHLRTHPSMTDHADLPEPDHDCIFYFDEDLVPVEYNDKENQKKFSWFDQVNKIIGFELLLSDNNLDWKQIYHDIAGYTGSDVIYVLAEQGYTDILQIILEKGIEQDVLDECLCFAARKGQTDIIRLLLFFGANINYQSGAALLEAIAAGPIAIDTVTYLLSQGIKHPRSSEYCLELLREACSSSDTKTIDLLIISNLLSNEDMDLALMHTVSMVVSNNRNDEYRCVPPRNVGAMIRYLCGRGAGDWKGDVLVYAVTKGLPRVVQLLLLYGNYSTQIEYETDHATATTAVATVPVAATVTPLKKEYIGGRKWRRIDRALFTALFVEKFAIATYLIQQGANIKWKQDQVLTYFAEAGQVETVRYLLENGANPRVIDLERVSGHLVEVRNLITTYLN